LPTSIFLPQKINVGYQERTDTYTGKLAYVIYFDEKGKLRKEASWNGWRNQKLSNDIYENAPTSGFVLNKKVGGYSTGWNHRQTYVRVYDPRGFEFEINVPNLLFVLENATSTKGKGLEGEFVYGWDGTDLVLVPTDSPDYTELTKINKLRHAQEFIKAKDLKIGATYLSKDNTEHIYIGRFDEYDWYGNKKAKPFFYFYSRNSEGFSTMPSISQRFVAVVSADCVDDYSSIFEKLERTTTYSPVDHNAYEYIPYTLEEFVKRGKKTHWFYFYNANKVAVEVSGNYNDEGKYRVQGRERVQTKTKNPWGYGYDSHEYPTFVQSATLEEIFSSQCPMWRKVYLTNGKLYQEEKS
jgi:hypothetical protein